MTTGSSNCKWMPWVADVEKRVNAEWKPCALPETCEADIRYIDDSWTVQNERMPEAIYWYSKECPASGHLVDTFPFVISPRSLQLSLFIYTSVLYIFETSIYQWSVLLPLSLSSTHGHWLLFVCTIVTLLILSRYPFLFRGGLVNSIRLFWTIQICSMAS